MADVHAVGLPHLSRVSPDWPRIAEQAAALAANAQAIHLRATEQLSEGLEGLE